MALKEKNTCAIGAAENGCAPSVPRDRSFWERKNHNAANVCKNCGTAVTDKFCPHCGQKTRVKRLKFSATVDNFITAVFHLERGIIKTAGMLFYRPGYMARDYIEGKRVSYANPFSLMVLLAGIYSVLYILMLWTQSGQTNTLDAMDVDLTELLGGKELTPFWLTFAQVVRWLYDSSVVLSIFMLPIYTLAIKLVFWRPNRGRYNFTELLFLSGFLAAQRFIFDLIALPFRWVFYHTDSFDYLIFLAPAYFVFTFLALKQLFGGGWIGTFFRTVLVFILSSIMLLTSVVLLLALVYWISEGENIFTEGGGVNVINVE